MTAAGDSHPSVPESPGSPGAKPILEWTPEEWEAWINSARGERAASPAPARGAETATRTTETDSRPLPPPPPPTPRPPDGDRATPGRATPDPQLEGDLAGRSGPAGPPADVRTAEPTRPAPKHDPVGEREPGSPERATAGSQAGRAPSTADDAAAAPPTPDAPGPDSGDPGAWWARIAADAMPVTDLSETAGPAGTPTAVGPARPAPNARRTGGPAGGRSRRMKVPKERLLIRLRSFLLLVVLSVIIGVAMAGLVGVVISMITVAIRRATAG